MKSPSLQFKIILLLFLCTFHNLTHAFSKEYHKTPHADTLIIGDYAKPSLINPILTHSTISAVLKDIVFDGPVRINERMEPEPHLALSWDSSENGLTWRFYIRKNVLFHDGIELTAEDVKFTFDKINDPSLKSPYISIVKNFKSVRVKDRYTLEIDLKNPLPSLPFYLDVGILPKHLLIGKDIRKADFNYHPVGTGPFTIERWSLNEIILKAHEDYFEGRPRLDRVIVKFFKDQRVVWAESMKGTVDCVFLAFMKNYDIIEKIPRFNVYSFLNPYYYIVALNKDRIFFRQKCVRQALNCAIDKEGLVTKVLRGRGRVSSGTIYPQSWAHSRTSEPYPYDPKKALELLHNAGWKDTNGNNILDRDGREFQFVLLTAEGDDVARGCALQMQQQLLDIGIRMTIKPMPFSVIYQYSLSTKKFDAVLLYIISDDPDKNYAWWHSSQINGGFNVFSYKNEKVDDLLDRGRITLDREERKKIYHRFQREIHDDPPGIFLFWRDYLIGIHKRFRGVRLSPAGILSNIHEWYVPKEEQKYK